jgi:phosphate transport system permease protein
MELLDSRPRAAVWRVLALPGLHKRGGDRVFFLITVLFAALILGIAATMVITLVIQAWPSITQFGPGFIAGPTWNPAVNHFGALVFLFGTVYTSLLALALAVPLSLGVAIFLAEMAPPVIRGPATVLVELLAAIPSVVYGLWGIYVLTAVVGNPIETWLGGNFGWIPIFSGPPYGSGILAAALILTVMIIPTITSISTDLIKRVPREQREAMLALGATPWETTTRVVLPYARAGIIGAIMLGLGRAVGETMAVTMVIGNGRSIGPSLFAVTDTMASVIANQFTEATGPLYPAALLELGLLLFLLTMLLNFLARLLVWRYARIPQAGSQQ